MDLSACIVVYNGAEEALRAAQTVLDCTRRHPLTLYLVDNASPDGSGQRLTRAAADGTLRMAPKKAALLGDMVVPYIHIEEKKCTVLLCDEAQKPYAVVEFQ